MFYGCLTLYSLSDHLETPIWRSTSPVTASIAVPANLNARTPLSMRLVHNGTSRERSTMTAHRRVDSRVSFSHRSSISLYLISALNARAFTTSHSVQQFVPLIAVCPTQTMSKQKRPSWRRRTTLTVSTRSVFGTKPRVCRGPY